MARKGWLGLPRLGFTPRPRTVACVLSGGGAKASFQLGCLAYLYEHDPRFAPSIFVGTSAGSILASGLAQFADRDAQHGFSQKLTDIWLSMQKSSDMFTPRRWMSQAETDLPEWLGMLSPAEHDAPASQPERSSLLPFRPAHVADDAVSPETPPDPIDLALQEDPTEPKLEWSLGQLAQLARNLTRLPRMGSGLASIRMGVERSQSMYRPGPVLAELLKPEVFDEDRVAAAGTTLRISMVALESGHLRFMCEDGRMVDRDDHPVDETRHRLVNGVLASCSIPGVFRAVPLGNSTYVDGGTRESLPAEMAIGQLRAERTYVLSCQSDGVPSKPSMADADIFTVVMRATEILMDEAGRDEMAYAESTDAIIVRPEISVHDAMTVHPGLLQINWDYGWLRAAEQVLHATPEEVERHRRIIALRTRCVPLEEELAATPDDADADSLADAKLEIRRLVDQSNPAMLPPGAGEWWSRLEKHADPCPLETFWVK